MFAFPGCVAVVLLVLLAAPLVGDAAKWALGKVVARRLGDEDD